MKTKMIFGLALLLAGAPAAMAQQARSCGSAEKLQKLLCAAVSSGAQADKDALAQETFVVSKCLAGKNVLTRSGLKGVNAIILDVISSLTGRPIVLVNDAMIAAAARKLPKAKTKKLACGGCVP